MVWRPADMHGRAGPLSAAPAQGMYMGCGLGLGGAVGGLLYDEVGGPATFALTAAFLAASWLACGLAQLWLRAHTARRRESGDLTEPLMEGA